MYLHQLGDVTVCKERQMTERVAPPQKPTQAMPVLQQGSGTQL